MNEFKQIFWTRISCNVAKIYGDVDELINKIAKMQREACRDDGKYSVVRYDKAGEYCHIKIETTWSLYKPWIMRLKRMYPAMCDFLHDSEMWVAE